MNEPILFVLGAGFTRAFVEKAPLLIDDFGIEELLGRFLGFPRAAAVLRDALADSPKRVDLERLWTRLQGMPYDDEEARRELALLESEIRQALIRRLNDAKAAGVDEGPLTAFARYVVEQGASVVTFNYDDILDQRLHAVREAVTSFETAPYWHPDGGYGFFCRPSLVCVSDTPITMDRSKSLLLKLHGSVNWRCRLGEAPARGPAALLHHESWVRYGHRAPVYTSDEIESHLETDPFIVPPVLAKSELGLHPVLRVVWRAARRKLKEAATVVFVGYSLPQTDLGSRTLFRETLADRTADVYVVNQASLDTEKKRVIEAYRSVFPAIDEHRFDFGGARNRIGRDFSREPAPGAS